MLTLFLRCRYEAVWVQTVERLPFQRQCHAFMVIHSSHLNKQSKCVLLSPETVATYVCDVHFVLHEQSYLFTRHMVFAGAVGLVTQPFYSSTLWWPSQPGKCVADITNFVFLICLFAFVHFIFTQCSQKYPEMRLLLRTAHYGFSEVNF